MVSNRTQKEIISQHLLPGQLNALLLDAVFEIDSAQKEFESRTDAAVNAEHSYRKCKAIEMLKLTEGTVQEKAAAVDLACDKERLAAHLAEGLREAALERVRNCRQKLSAIQSMGANSRLEEELTRAPQPKWQQDF